jgi:hypothetical protein
MKLEHMQAFIDKFRYFLYYIDLMQKGHLWFNQELKLLIKWNLFNKL